MIVAENSDFEGAVSEILLIESIDEIQIERCAKGRGWAIWVGDRLLGVAVNRSSALAIRDSLVMLRRRLRP
jgi:hypothetical protein